MTSRDIDPIKTVAVEQRFHPRDPETFFAAQRRNRRATWRFSVLCAIAAVVMGIPLSLTVTPVLYAVGLIVADVINLITPLPRSFWQQADHISRFGMIALNWLFEHRPADPQSLAAGALVMLVPGALFSILLWLGVNVIFRHGGVGGALLALRAREPNQSELKELELADVAQEMAIAAGLPVPRVMLIDAPGANAAVIGTSAADAHIVISRALVDRLERGELEAVLAHLVVSVGNGDLRIAFRIMAVFEACGLLVSLINAPFGPQSRRALWQIVRYAFRGSTKDGGASESAAVADLLSRSIASDTDDIDRFLDSTGKKSVFRSIRSFLFFPIVFTNAAIKLSLLFFSYGILGPSVALLWRTRCYLADASAIELTRNPDQLASALNKLKSGSSISTGSGWAAYLFIVNPEGGDESSSVPGSAQQQILAQAWIASASSPHQASTLHAPELQPSDFAVLYGQFMSTIRAALGGDAEAEARIRFFKQALSAADPALAAYVPDIADLAAARQGDRHAMARLQTSRAHLDTLQQGDAAAPSSDSTSVSMIDFHPSVERRLKRLEQMGAHLNLPDQTKSNWMVPLFFSLIFAPLIILMIGLFLLALAIMTMASLTFLVIWIAVIHQIFGLFANN